MRRPALFLCSAALLFGCDNQSGLLDGIKEAEARLELTLDQTSVEAGQSVSYEVQVFDAAGNEVPAEVLGPHQLSSLTEPDLFWTRTTLVPQASGPHDIVASIPYGGETLKGTAPLLVEAARAEVLDLSLDDYSMPAGGRIGFEVVATDRYGNTTPARGAEVTVDQRVVKVKDTHLTSTRPGIYTAHAKMGRLTDSEDFVVVTGAPETISLELSDTDLELLETSHATVVITDAHGNITDDPWTLTTDRGAPATRVSHSNVSFFEEGWHTVTATVDGTNLSASVGPMLIDSTGPVLVLDRPGRGDWDTDNSEPVSGNVYDDWSGVTLTVDGQTVVPDANGDFSTTVSPSFGVNVIEVEAVDGDGNVTSDSRASLSGSFRSYGSRIGSGIEVQINQGPGGTDVLEALGEGLISRYDLDDLLPSNPVFSDYSQDCTNPCGLWGGSCPVCVEWYSVNLNVYNPRIGGTDLVIDPRGTGRLRLTMSVLDPSLDWSGNGAVIGVGYSGSGDITADAITVQVEVVPRASNGNIYLDIYSVNAWATNFWFDMDGWLYDAITFFGVDVSGMIEGFMIDAIEDAVRDEVPPVLEGALQDLELAYDVPIMGRTYTIDAQPGGFDVRSWGLTLELDTRVTVDQTVHSGSTGLGSLYGAYAAPSWTSTPGMGVGMSGDFVNQLLYATWRGGLLDLETDSAALGLGADDLSTFLPGVSQLTISAWPALPPVVVPGSGSAEYELQIGDLELILSDGPPNGSNELIHAWVTAYADLNLGTVGDESLNASVTNVDVHIDVVLPEAHTRGATDTEALLEAIVPMLMPMLTDALGEIAIPDIQGFGINGINVSTGGGSDGYLMLKGNLVER